MIIDSSALVAVLFREADAEKLMTAMHAAERRRMATPNWLETWMVFEGRTSPESHARLDDVLADPEIKLVPFDAELAARARMANRRFGKSRHDARLNFGDCMAYALAKQTGEPLLFIGNDFIHTDITPALT